MIGAYRGPRQPRVRDGVAVLSGLLRKQALPSTAAVRPADADEPGSDGGPRGPAAESSLDHSCYGSASYQ